MKLLTAFIFVCAMILGAEGQALKGVLREELLAMEITDQEARKKCTNRTADEQIKCLAKISETIDAPNTRRLEEIFEKYGFPTVKMVGKDGFQAFLLLVQYSPSDSLRKKSLKPIKEAFKRKEVSPLEYANFIDRLLLRQGKPQIYGSGFETKDGRLVMSKTIDVKYLDKRRAEIGLPPIAEYIEMLKEIYNLEVERRMYFERVDVNVTSMKRNKLLFLCFLLLGAFTITAAAQLDNRSDSSQPQIVDKPVKIKKKPQSSARGCQAQSSGRMQVKVTFDKSAFVTEVMQLSSSGCNSFDREALRAARKIQFEPAVKDGAAITVVKTVEYAYSVY